MPRVASVSYYVAPRYTPGSPALVDEDTAMRVADDEKKDYERLMDPSYAGIVPADEAKAKRLGLAGIVEARSESKEGWSVTDVLTGERFWRGEVQAIKVVPRDRIVRIDSIHYVHSMRSHDGTPVLPMVVERIDVTRQRGTAVHTIIHGKDLHGNEEVLYCKYVKAHFHVERGR